MVFEGLGASRHAGRLRLGYLRAEWHLGAFREGCDYGGSGQLSRAALWYHSVRLRHHHVMGGSPTLSSVVVSASAVTTRPERFPSRFYPFARCPVASTPARLPPRPPFQGVAGGGELGGGDWDELGCLFWDLAGGSRWCCMTAVPGCCRDIPSCFSCRPPLWGSLAGVSGLVLDPGDMQAVYPPHGMTGLPSPPGWDWISTRRCF